MSFLPALAIAFAAFVVWLTVRIINRRERWAKWMFVTTVGLPVLYVVSFGPACWIVSRVNWGDSVIPVVYRPIIQVMQHEPWTAVHTTLARYSRWGAHPDWNWANFNPRGEGDWKFGRLRINRIKLVPRRQLPIPLLILNGPGEPAGVWEPRGAERLAK